MTPIQNEDTAKKATRKEIIASLCADAVEWTDNTFIVTSESDDGGGHIVVNIERNTDDSTGLKVSPFNQYMGRRLIFISVPRGYLGVFYDKDGTKKRSEG